MATTIKLKNGSGAPLAGDLVQGEPAFDLTNKRLYTEDSGGSVIEVGTNPTSLTTGTFTSTGIDDNATSTAITIDSSENVGIGTASPSEPLSVAGNVTINSALYRTDTGAGGIRFSTAGNIRPVNTAGTSTDLALDIGDPSFRFNDLHLGGDAAIAGNVGIGTASPSFPLDVNGTAKAGALCVNTSSTTFQVNVSSPSSTTTNLASTSGSSVLRLTNSGGLATVGSNGNELYFTSSTTERLRIDASGNVGIGTTSPEVLTHLKSSDNTIFEIESTTPTAYMKMVDSNTTGAGYIGYVTNDMTFWANNAERMRIDASGSVHVGPSSNDSQGYTIDLSPTTQQTAGIDVSQSSPNVNLDLYAGGSPSNLGGWAGQIRFMTGGNNSLGTERMRIDSSGNLLVGTTASVGGGSEGVEIRNDFGYIKTARNNAGPVGHWLLYNPNGNVGSVTTSGSATTYNTSSDVRLKENIVDAPAGNIDDIRVRSFDWKVDGSHQTYGMVAQELVDVAPEAVTQGETEEDMWGVDYSKLVPMMIKEIQDLKAEVAALKGE